MARKQARKKNEAFDTVYVIANTTDHQMIWACEGVAPTDLMDDEICLVYRYAGEYTGDKANRED